ncbi:MAG: Ig-like domain-containing protein [Plesiomonas shigelloides]
MMSKFSKGLLALVVLPLLVLLSGCNSEGAFSDPKDPPVPVVKLERIDIVASPITTRGVSELMLANGNKQSFEAVGHYSDGSSQSFTDLSLLDWHSSDTEAGRFDIPGVLMGVDVGNTAVTASKDGITSNTVTVTVTNAVITGMQVTPSPVSVAKGQTQQLTAMATYSDGTSSDVTDSVTWTAGDTSTATVNSAGLLSGVDVGNTTVTATKDTVISNTVNVAICADLAGLCIDLFDAGGGKLFTSSPSEDYLLSIGGSRNNGWTIETEATGPMGFFNTFSIENDNTADALCATYNNVSLGGRTNWRLATEDELKMELYDKFGNMFTARGWPTRLKYVSANPGIPVSLNDGNNSSFGLYASCVSEP